MRLRTGSHPASPSWRVDTTGYRTWIEFTNDSMYNVYVHVGSMIDFVANVYSKAS